MVVVVVGSVVVVVGTVVVVVLVVVVIVVVVVVVGTVVVVVDVVVVVVVVVVGPVGLSLIHETPRFLSPVTSISPSSSRRTTICSPAGITGLSHM